MRARENGCENRFFVESEIRGHARVWTIDKLDEARTNADDQMMLMQHCSGDRVMSLRGFGRISQADRAIGGRHARRKGRRAGGNDSLHDVRARLKISSQ